MKTLLFPSSYFSPREVDEDLRPEYEAATETGLFQFLIFDYDKWFNEDRLVIRNSPETMTDAVYRGWMMKPDQYERFYHELLNKNIRLCTNPNAYEQMHAFPNAYSFFNGETPEIMLFPLHERVDLDLVKKRFERFMVKDHVKSVKGTDFPRYFDSTVTQSEFDHWMEKFYDYRGSLLTGGICIKEYVDLKKYGEHVNEFRVYYISGQIATISENSGQGNYVARPPRAMIEKYASLPSPFYTIDFAEKADGTWIVIECGDGQVSGLSDNQNQTAFYRALYYCM